MTAAHFSQLATLLSFACLAIGALGMGIRVLAFGRLIVAQDWRGHVFKWVLGLGWLMFGAGCAIRTGLFPVPQGIAMVLIGLGVIFGLFWVMLVYRSVGKVPGTTGGQAF